MTERKFVSIDLSDEAIRRELIAKGILKASHDPKPKRQRERRGTRHKTPVDEMAKAVKEFRELPIVRRGSLSRIASRHRLNPASLYNAVYKTKRHQ